MGSVSLTLVNIEQGVFPDLKTTQIPTSCKHAWCPHSVQNYVSGLFTWWQKVRALRQEDTPAHYKHPKETPSRRVTWELGWSMRSWYLHPQASQQGASV